MRFRSLWTALLSANLLACAPYDYDAERNNSSFKPVGYPVYTLDKNGNTIKSRRMTDRYSAKIRNLLMSNVFLNRVKSPTPHFPRY